jgi:molybdopterin converting factor small subunit
MTRSNDADPDSPRMRVRVLQLGRRVLDHQARSGATLEGVLAEVGLAIGQAGVDVRVNGADAKPDRPLRDGDVVTLIPRIKGGAQVAQGRLGHGTE